LQLPLAKAGLSLSRGAFQPMKTTAMPALIGCEVC
jgi:hypothetical protein